MVLFRAQRILPNQSEARLSAQYKTNYWPYGVKKLAGARVALKER